MFGRGEFLRARLAASLTVDDLNIDPGVSGTQAVLTTRMFGNAQVRRVVSLNDLDLLFRTGFLQFPVCFFQKFLAVDQSTLVGGFADRSGLVIGFDGKADDLSLHCGDLCLCAHLQPYGRCGNVLQVQLNADGGFGICQSVGDGFAGGSLHQRCHAGGGIDQQRAGADLLSGILPFHQIGGFALHADFDVHGYHVLSFSNISQNRESVNKI